MSVYASTSSLGGNWGCNYGFTVCSGGTGSVNYNVGSNGSCFGVSNNTNQTIWQLLKSCDSQSSGGSLYGGNTTKKNACNVVFSDINQKGDLAS